MKRTTASLIVLISLVSLACNVTSALPFLATPTPTSTLTPTSTPTPTMTPTPTLTPTPTITPTPSGEIVSEPKEGYSLYIPDGFSAYCDKGVCIISQDSKGYYKGMWVNYAELPKSYTGSERDLFFILFMNGMLDKFKQLGVTAQEKSDPYEVNFGGMDGHAIDFTGTAGSTDYPMEGQIVALSPNPEHIFWAMAWVDTSSESDIWRDKGEDIFHFILDSTTIKE